jgi:hypothetical protein
MSDLYRVPPGVPGLVGQTPVILLRIEPWFVVGGVAFGGMASSRRRRSSPAG